MLQGAPYSYLLIAISCAGLTFNMGSLCIVARQKFRKLFHRLLVLLALYDSMVSLHLNAFFLKDKEY